MSIILYCDKCGQRVRPEDLEAGRARQVGEVMAYCPTCLPSVEKEKSKAEEAPPPADRPPGTGPRQERTGEAAPPKSDRPRMLHGIILAASLFGGFGLVVLLMSRSGAVPPAKPTQSVHVRDAGSSAGSPSALPPNATSSSFPSPVGKPPQTPSTAAIDEAAANREIQTADEFHQINPDAPEETIARYKRILVDHPGTNAAYNAEMRILRIQNRVAKPQVPATQKAPPVAKAPPPPKPMTAMLAPATVSRPGAKKPDAASPPGIPTTELDQTTSNKAASRSGVTYEEAVELAIGTQPLAEVRARMAEAAKAGLGENEPQWRRLSELVESAAAAEAALVRHLAAKVGERIVIKSPSGRPRFVKVVQSGAAGVLIEAAGATTPLRFSALRSSDLRKLVRAELGASDETSARIAALALLRGNPATVQNQFRSLRVEWRQDDQPILDKRQAAGQEEAAETSLQRFQEFVAKSNRAAAKKLGAEILRKYRGTQALDRLNPALEARLAELSAHSAKLRGVFLCDFKRLPRGRVSLKVDPNRPEHWFDLVNRSLAARFREVDAEFMLSNDGRWDRVFHLGDTVLYHYQKGGQTIEHQGKKYDLSHSIPTGKSTANKHAGGALRKYRLRAGPKGISFQIDSAKPQIVPVPWPGGRLMWPGHHQIAPAELRVTGRLDPLWVSEMTAVAKDRARFVSGAPLDLKPKMRPVVRPELEPWLHSYAYGRNHELRPLFGWHQVGAGWSVQSSQWVSPKPTDGRKTWWSVIWPAALISRDAELEFEARIDRGQLDVLLPAFYRNNKYRTNHEYIIIEPAGIKFAEIGTFSSKPGHRSVKAKVQSQAKPKLKKWHHYKVALLKDTVKVYFEGQLALERKVASTGKGAMAFFVYPGSEVRLRKVRIRKLETQK